jgi:hypothetical protein
MQWRTIRLRVSILIWALAAPIAFSADVNNSKAVEGGWKLAAETKEAIIYSRPHQSSSLKEFKAVGSIDAPPSAVNAVLDDVASYPDFMPYTVECRMIKQERDSIIGYQRISPKILADRDYTLRISKKSQSTPAGTVFQHRWVQANELGPPEKKGVVRVKVCEGGWLLEPDGSNKTRATYTLYTDSGAPIPAFLANRVSQTGISRLFAAVRKQVKNPKYASGQ